MTVAELRRMLAMAHGKSVVVFCQNPGAGLPVLPIVGAVETELDVRATPDGESARVKAVVIVSG